MKKSPDMILINSNISFYSTGESAVGIVESYKG